MKFFKCSVCGEVVVLDSVDTNVHCGKIMEELIPNSVDASFEKHVPVYKVVNDTVEVFVGENEHPMIDEHYIMFIAMINDDNFDIKKLSPGQSPKVEFPYEKNSKIYAYCNIHGLWVNDVK